MNTLLREKSYTLNYASRKNAAIAPDHFNILR